MKFNKRVCGVAFNAYTGGGDDGYVTEKKIGLFGRTKQGGGANCRR